jgi:hypothetical protein
MPRKIARMTQGVTNFCGQVLDQVFSHRTA